MRKKNICIIYRGSHIRGLPVVEKVHVDASKTIESVYINKRLTLLAGSVCSVSSAFSIRNLIKVPKKQTSVQVPNFDCEIKWARYELVCVWQIE